MNAFLVVGIFDIGGPELMLILVVTLLLFGAKKLPEMARNIGRSVEEFKRAANHVRHEVMTADIEDPPAVRSLPEPEEPPAATEAVPAVTELPVATSKAEITLQVSSTAPAGTVSQNGSHEQKSAETV